MLRLGKSKGLVGLDIGSSSVKAMELAKNGNKYEVLNLAVEEFGRDGSVVDSGSIALAIGKIFSEQNIKTDNVATAVSGHSVIVKRITVAGDTPDELAEAISCEAEQSVQLSMDEIRWDYDVLGPAPSGRSAYHAMLVAVKREKILSHTEVLREAGKTPVVVDIDAFALQNAWEASYEPQPDELAALLDIGASVMNINIVRGGKPLFTRDVSVGGNHCTEVLQKELDLNFEDAERLKLGREVATVSSEVRTAHLRSASEALLLDIQKTFDFFRETTSTDAIHHIYLAGGSANLCGLADCLEEELQIPVEVLNPFRQVRFKRSNFDADEINVVAPRMAVAMGLALRKFDES